MQQLGRRTHERVKVPNAKQTEQQRERRGKKRFLSSLSLKEDKARVFPCIYIYFFCLLWFFLSFYCCFNLLGARDGMSAVCQFLNLLPDMLVAQIVKVCTFLWLHSLTLMHFYYKTNCVFKGIRSRCIFCSIMADDLIFYLKQ